MDRSTMSGFPYSAGVGFVLLCGGNVGAMIDAMVSSVLIVDDDAAFLALAKRVLEEIGVKAVSTAPDAAAAVAAADERRPEAALVDVGLPDRDGIELARQLAALPWSPRVVLTSTDPDAVRLVELRHGDRVLPFIAKEDLASGALQRLLAGE